MFTLLTPLAAKTHLYFLYAVRIIEVGERIHFPLLNILSGSGSGRGGHLPRHVRHAGQVGRAKREEQVSGF